MCLDECELAHSLKCQTYSQMIYAKLVIDIIEFLLEPLISSYIDGYRSKKLLKKVILT